MINRLLVIPIALAAVALLAGCGGQHGTADHQGHDEKGHGEQVAGFAAPAAAPSADAIDRSILNDPGRPEKEKEQDAARKALDIYAWLGIGPGMTVTDMFCSGGYNTHLLSRVVGEERQGLRRVRVLRQQRGVRRAALQGRRAHRKGQDRTASTTSNW